MTRVSLSDALRPPLAYFGVAINKLGDASLNDPYVPTPVHERITTLLLTADRAAAEWDWYQARETMKEAAVALRALSAAREVRTLLAEADEWLDECEVVEREFSMRPSAQVISLAGMRARLGRVVAGVGRPA
jgi:hypothetical protein